MKGKGKIEKGQGKKEERDLNPVGFRFAPRICNLGDTKLFISKDEATYDALKQGMVTASLIRYCTILAAQELQRFPANKALDPAGTGVCPRFPYQTVLGMDG